MLGIYLIMILAGRPFYRMALEYDKNPWLYGFFGILVFLIGSNLSVFIIAITLMIVSTIDLSTYDENVLGLIGVPFGAVICWCFYRFLNKRWSQSEALNSSSEILDDDFMK